MIARPTRLQLSAACPGKPLAETGFRQVLSGICDEPGAGKLRPLRWTTYRVDSHRKAQCCTSAIGQEGLHCAGEGAKAKHTAEFICLSSAKIFLIISRLYAGQMLIVY
eukprot:363333-Chlamydomonas_euryale.AAC.5